MTKSSILLNYNELLRSINAIEISNLYVLYKPEKHKLTAEIMNVLNIHHIF